MPIVSIGFPVYNGEKYLSQAIDSILAQDFKDFELIISDNASTDGTSRICRQYACQDNRIKYTRNSVNCGLAPNFNRVVELASGKYFMWMAHDDMHAPLYIKRCVEEMEMDPSLVLCFTKTEFIDEFGKSIKPYRHPVRLEEPSTRIRFLNFTHSTHIVVEIFGLMRTDILRQTPLIGSYVGSDLVLLAELALHGPFKEIQEVLFFHREHPQRSTYEHQNMEERTAWFDSKKTGRFVFPHWRRLWGHFLSVSKSNQSMPLKFRLCYDLLRVANWQRYALMQDIKVALRKILYNTKKIARS